MRDRAWSLARQDILQLAKDRERKLSEFHSAAGWTLVVNAPASAPLFPQPFDPLNVLNLGNGRVLYTRHVRMGNDAGFVEAFGCADGILRPPPIVRGRTHSPRLQHPT
jgi:hypothetical protein